MSYFKHPSIDSDADPLTPLQRQRYAGHLALAEIGENGQQKLLNSKVLCIGAGGLGSPVAIYLVAAGVGTLGIVDDDVVDRSNLQRQILHSEARIDMPKTESAQVMLSALNPEVLVNAYPERLSADNAQQLIAEYDVVVDGSDNYSTRYLISDVCRRLNRPHVYGAVHEFTGQVAVFWPNQSGNPCYRCLFSEEDQAAQANCVTHGVLGMVPGVIGTLQAVEAIKLIVGCGEPLMRRLLTYDALGSRFRALKVRADTHCYCRK